MKCKAHLKVINFLNSTNVCAFFFNQIYFYMFVLLSINISNSIALPVKLKRSLNSASHYLYSLFAYTDKQRIEDASLLPAWEVQKVHMTDKRFEPHPNVFLV